MMRTTFSIFCILCFVVTAGCGSLTQQTAKEQPHQAATVSEWVGMERPK